MENVENEQPNNPEVEAPAPEKVLTQSQVNKIVQREKELAAQKGRREAEENYQKELEALRQQQTQRNENVSRDVDADRIYQQIQERFNKEMQERQLHQEMTSVADNYLTKMRRGKDSYEDFEEITKDFDPAAFPQLTYLVAGMDNAEHIIYDLQNNPQKLVALDTLAIKAPQKAKNELLKLSQSISENRNATADAEKQTTSEPLTRLNPSRVSGSSGNKPTISDLRNLPWMKG